MSQIKDDKIIMKIKNLISVTLLSRGVMGTGLYSGDSHQKIRNRFNIQESYCAVKTNGVLGFSNRKDVLQENGDSAGTTSSNTSAMALTENGENEVSLEIGALRWLSDKPVSTEEREHFSQKAGCSLDLVRSVKQEETMLSSIEATINQQGIPEAQLDSMHPVIRKEILTRQTEPRFIDPDYFNETYFPKEMKVYQFTQKVLVAGLPEWVWVQAAPFTGSDGQLQELKAAYIEMAAIISSGDRTRLKTSRKEALKARSVTIDDSEDEILPSLYPKEEVEDRKARMQPIRQDDYAIRVMNSGRMVQLYNESKSTYSPLTYRFIGESSDEVTGYYVPVFSLVDGQSIPAT